MPPSVYAFYASTHSLEKKQPRFLKLTQNLQRGWNSNKAYKNYKYDQMVIKEWQVF